MSNNLFAIDIGGTDIKYGVVTPENDVISTGKTPTPYETPEHLVNLLVQLVLQCPEQVDGIAVSLPGSPYGNEGIVRRGGALKYLRGFPLGEALHKASGLPATLENDGRCAALGEYCAGALQNAHCGVMLVIGTSLGGGILLDARQHFPDPGHHLLHGSGLACVLLRLTALEFHPAFEIRFRREDSAPCVGHQLFGGLLVGQTLRCVVVHLAPNQLVHAFIAVHPRQIFQRVLLHGLRSFAVEGVVKTSV